MGNLIVLNSELEPPVGMQGEAKHGQLLTETSKNAPMNLGSCGMPVGASSDWDQKETCMAIGALNRSIFCWFGA